MIDWMEYFLSVVIAFGYIGLTTGLVVGLMRLFKDDWIKTIIVSFIVLIVVLVPSLLYLVDLY